MNVLQMSFTPEYKVNGRFSITGLPDTGPPPHLSPEVVARRIKQFKELRVSDQGRPRKIHEPAAKPAVVEMRGLKRPNEQTLEPAKKARAFPNREPTPPDVVINGNPRYAEGARVKIQGLKDGTEYNGKLALIKEWKEEKGRYEVELTGCGTAMLLKPVNLERTTLSPLRPTTTRAPRSRSTSPVRKSPSPSRPLVPKPRYDQWVAPRTHCVVHIQSDNALPDPAYINPLQIVILE